VRFARVTHGEKNSRSFEGLTRLTEMREDSRRVGADGKVP